MTKSKKMITRERDKEMNKIKFPYLISDSIIWTFLIHKVLFRVKFKFRVSDIFSTARKTKLLFITFDLNDCVSSRLFFLISFSFYARQEKIIHSKLFCLFSSSPGKKKRKIEFTALTLWGWVQFFLVPRSILNRFFFLFLSCILFTAIHHESIFLTYIRSSAGLRVSQTFWPTYKYNTVKLTRKKAKKKQTTQQLLKRGMCLSRKSSREIKSCRFDSFAVRKRISFSLHSAIHLKFRPCVYFKVVLCAVCA